MRFVLDQLNLSVYEILGFVGPSGAGKSVLMRTVLGLKSKTSGEINLFGHDISNSQI